MGKQTLVVILVLLAVLLPACRTRPAPEPQVLQLATAPVTVSGGPSPYAACTLGATKSGVRFAGGEVEPWVAVNPQALKEGKVNLVGVYQSDRWSDGGASGLTAATSFDGGATWQTQPLAFNGCAGNGLLPAGRASDPWVAFGPDGRAYASALVVDKATRTYAVAMATSADGGRTWGDYQILQQETREDTLAGVDKESVTADPNRPGTAYAVWMRNVAPRDQYHIGPAIFSRTTDGGKTWSSPKMIFEAQRGQMASGSILVADPRSGALYHFFRWIDGWGIGTLKNSVGFQVSKDGGETWSAAERVISMQARQVTHPAAPDGLRTFGELPVPALDPATGRLYVTWEDARFREAPLVDVALAYSDDGGTTWSEPVRVNLGADSAFRPTVAVNSRGQVGVSYYQLTRAGGMQIPAELRLAVFERDLQTRQDRPVAAPFDLGYAPKAPGPFIGDYQGLTGVAEWFHLFYVTANADGANPTDVHAVSIRP